MHSYPQGLQVENLSSEKIGVGFLCLLFFIAGILISPSNIFPVLKPFRPQYVFALVAGIALMLGLFTKTQKLNWTGIQTSYTLFMIATLASLMNLVEYNLLADGLDRFNYSLKTWIMVVLIGAYAAQPRLFKICFGFFLFVVVAFQVHCLKAYFAGVGSVGGRFDSWVGQISNPDFIGTFFAVMVPIQLELFLVQKKSLMKIIFFASCIAGLFIMVKTQTRAAFLSLILAFFLWSIIKERFNTRIKLAILVLGIFLVFGSLSDTVTDYSGGFFGRMKTIFSSEARKKDPNIQSRLYLWNQGIQIWSQFPIFGCGVGGMDPHQTLKDGIDPTGGRGLSSYSLHQAFIQVFAERGILGGIPYMFFILYIFAYLSRIKRLCRQNRALDHSLAIATGLQLGMTAFVLGGLFMSIQENWILIFFAGLTSALYKSVQLVKEAPPQQISIAAYDLTERFQR
jgi:O-antigen ligase